MAKRNDKSIVVAAVDNGGLDEPVEVAHPYHLCYGSAAKVSQTTPDETPAHAPRRPKKGPRPSIEIVEISSGEEDGEEQERFGGVLRGLNPKNVIPPTQISIETEDAAAEGVVITQTARHGTRQSHYGKTQANYSMKVSTTLLRATGHLA